MREATKKTRTVEYWECDLGHEHKSKATADGCIQKRAHRAGYSKAQINWRVRTFSAIVRLRLSGASYKDIGRIFNIGPGRASAIYKDCVSIADGKWAWAHGRKVTNAELISDSLDADALSKLRGAQ